MPLVNFIKHKFVSAKAQSADATLASKTEWNDDHDIRIPFGQCRLIFSSATSVLLIPYKGNYFAIPGVAGTQRVFEIPSAGVSKSNAGLAANTSYFVYAFWTGSALDLEISATGHATDAGSGIEIKSGDSTRVLVSQVRTNASSQFEDSLTKRFVSSWFNRIRKGMTAPATADRTTSTTGSYVEIHTELRIEFLVWADEAVSVAALGKLFADTSGKNVNMSVGFDGATAEDTNAVHFVEAAAVNQGRDGTALITKILTEGYHFATMLIRLDAGTANGGVGGSATTGLRSTMQGSVKV